MPKNFFPISEFTMNMVPGLLLADHPIVTILVFTLFSPFAVGGMFYAVGFAPLASRKPWLGYLMVTVALAIPSAFDILWRGQADMVIPLFLLNLPIHLIACWSYQKADTVWAPIATLSIFNLVTSILSMLFI